MSSFGVRILPSMVVFLDILRFRATLGKRCALNVEASVAPLEHQPRYPDPCAVT